jgi:hypothetical protein
MQKLHNTLSRPSRPEGPRSRPRSRQRLAAGGAAVLLALLGPALSGGQAQAAASTAAASTTAPSATAPSATASSDRLLPGEVLKPGQSIASGYDTLTMRGNGNLVLVAPGRTPIWSSHTGGNQGAQLVMQPNGNATIQAPAGAPPGSTALWSTDTYRQTYADIQLAAHGWSQGQARQFGCLNSIWLRESKWNELAGSPASAYGIPQASPGAKMAAAGPDWLTSPQTQIRWGEDYIEGQYGTPCQAWAYWQVHKNY